MEFTCQEQAEWNQVLDGEMKAILRKADAPPFGFGFYSATFET